MPDPPDQVVLSPVYSNIKPYDPNEVTLSAWVMLFDEFCMAYGIAAEPAPVAPATVPIHNQRRALFLSAVGSKAFEVLRTACLPQKPNELSIPSLVEHLQQRFEPLGLKRANCLTFSKRIQRDNESVSEFISAIQDLASKCDYGANLDEALLDRLIAGLRNNDIRHKLISTPSLSYTDAKTLALQRDAVRIEAKALAQAVQISNVKPNQYCSQPHYNHSKFQSRPSSKVWSVSIQFQPFRF